MSATRPTSDRGEDNAPPSLEELEQQIRSLLLDAEPRFLEGVDRRPQEAYRQLVQGSHQGNILRAVPIAKEKVGEQAARSFAARFLDERAPATRLYRNIPLEFAAWLHELSLSRPDEMPHPAFAELVAWEVLELEVLGAPDPETGPGSPLHECQPRPSEDRVVVFDPSLRIAAYRHPVHTMKKGSPWPKAASAPVILVAWRSNERLRWLKLRPVVAQVLAQAAEGRPLGEVFAAVDEQAGGPIDRAFCRSWLVNLAGRGALLGFAPPDEPV